MNATADLEKAPSTWKSKTDQEKSLSFGSPSYARRRDNLTRNSQYGRDLFPQRSLGQWRPKQGAILEPPLNPPAEPVVHTTQDLTVAPQAQLSPVEERAAAYDTVMEELQEVTRQYLSCPDPVEAAARRQRVHFSDANWLMEQTASAILAASAAQSPRAFHHVVCESNPATPPPLQNYSSIEGRLPPQTAPLSPRTVEVNNHCYGDEASPTDTTLLRRTKAAKKVKSIIISPLDEQPQPHSAQLSPIILQEDNETLQEFQNKVRRKAAPTSKKRSSKESPNILWGASSKKRNLSQFHYSPRAAVGSSAAAGSSAANTAKSQKGSSSTREGEAIPKETSNPPIQLIPAVKRKKSDFRVLLPHAP